MKYINYLYLSEELGGSNLDTISAIMQDYTVWRSLISVGYQFIHVGSWWEATRENKYADVNINYSSIPEFSMLVIRNTMLYPVLAIFEYWRMTQYKRVLYKFDKLAEIPNIKEPTFVFAHMIIPHPPYVFDKAGNYLISHEANSRKVITNYVDQLTATNSMVSELIDELLSSSEAPPIIILQADEGPLPGAGYWTAWKGKEATEAEWRAKYGILNAYYLPNIDYKDILYPSITPVNSFRLVFNLFFDADFALLPDISYTPCDGYPFFEDVTDKVKYD